MISDVYSECDQCLENHPYIKKVVGSHSQNSDEIALKKKYKLKSITELLDDSEVPYDVKKKIIEDIKPQGPGENTLWFNGTNINQCLQRMSKKFSKMEGGLKSSFLANTKLEKESRHPLYIPFNMRDFESEGGSLNNVKLDKSFNCFGTVLNTDYSSGPGEHWLAIFVNLIKEPYTLEYFDSGGRSMMPEVYKYFTKLKEKIKVAYEPKEEVLILNITNRVQQKDDYSCGAYACYYIYARLQGVPWKYFREHEIGDHKMHKFRKHLFRS